jgi:hypothetical protein
LSLCHKAQQIENNNFVKFYDTNNFHVTYCNIALANEELVRIVELTNKINSCDYYELAKIYQNLVLKGTDEFEFGIWNIARKSLNYCYFNIITAEKDYFILEIIAVIHKVIA